MHMHDALAHRTFYKEPKAHVLGAPFVRLLGATNIAIARPATPGGLAVRRYLRTGA